MSVSSVDKDVDNLALTLVSDFDAPIERVWQLWADPRQLERWWGPPTYPASVELHDLTPGGEVSYFMTSPEGTKHRGWWRFISVDPPTSLEFASGFANSDGTANTNLPSATVRVQLSTHNGGTRMELRTNYESRENMEELLRMGQAEGLQAAVGQMDALLT